MITNDRFLKYIIIVQCTVYNANVHSIKYFDSYTVNWIPSMRPPENAWKSLGTDRWKFNRLVGQLGNDWANGRTEGRMEGCQDGQTEGWRDDPKTQTLAPKGRGMIALAEHSYFATRKKHTDRQKGRWPSQLHPRLSSNNHEAASDNNE